MLGVGAMGLPLARSLAAAGADVRVHDVDEARRRAAMEQGLAVATSLKELVGHSELLLTVLPGNAEAASLLDEGTLVAALRPGMLWIELTTAAPDVVSRAAATSRQMGAEFVAAALRGSPADAESGRIAFWAAGSATAVALATPVLTALGGSCAVTVVGDDPAHALVVKLLGNLLWFGQVVATTEVLLLGRSLGLEPLRLVPILRDGPGASAYLAEHVDALLEGDYLDSFRVDRVVEELEILQESASMAATPFELSALVLAIHEEASEAFGADSGELAAARLLEERAGTKLASGGRATSRSPGAAR